jgi:predicted transcriptional regulator
MKLPRMPKQEPKTLSVTTRLSPKTARALKELAKAHNISQATVVEHLIMECVKEEEKRKNAKKDHQAAGEKTE